MFLEVFLEIAVLICQLKIFSESWSTKYYFREQLELLFVLLLPFPDKFYNKSQQVLHLVYVLLLLIYTYYIANYFTENYITLIRKESIVIWWLNVFFLQRIIFIVGWWLNFCLVQPTVWWNIRCNFAVRYINLRVSYTVFIFFESEFPKFITSSLQSSISWKTRPKTTQ